MNGQKQLGQFHGVVLQNLPELTPAQLQAGIKNPLRVQKILVGLQDALRDTFKLVSAIDRDMTGWECVEPVKVEPGEFEFSLQEFLQPSDNGFVGGEEMVKRGKKQGANSGLRHIEAIIREQDKIPAEMRQFCLVSTEVWLNPDVYRYVWYAYWNGKRWILHCNYLGRSFYSSYRLLVPRKYQK